MPLHIILQDITEIECDAIVNAANNSLLGGGGVDGCIHRAAGPSLLAECRTLGGCPTGEAKLTKGYRLPAKYVIHTVGPIWQGGSFGEERLLRSCYKNSLQLAKEYGCESIAFPLISSGIYGYPKAAALAVAVEEIKAFLLENELTAYIVVFDKANFQIDDTLYSQVFDYILEQGNPYADVCKSCADLDEDFIPTPADALYSPKFFDFPRRKELFDGLEDGFSVTLLRLLDRKGVDEVACYKKANVSRQTWYKILNQKDYNPSKNTILSFAIALELDLEETKQLLSTAGYALSKSSKFDLIIEYFITNEQYDIFLINETLFKFDQPCLSM